MPDENDGVNNAVSCYKESVQFHASFVTVFHYLPFFYEICQLWNGNQFVFFSPMPELPVQYFEMCCVVVY